MASLTKEKASLQDDLTVKAGDLDELTSKYDSLKDDFNTAYEKAQNFENQTNDLQSSLEEVKGQLTTALGNVASLTKEKASLQDDLTVKAGGL